MTLARRRLPVALTVALSVFALACVLGAPVSLITLVLPPRLQLKNVQGTIWNGSAAAIGLGTMLVQERVEWHLNPPSLLSGRIEWLVSGRFDERSSTLSIGLGSAGVVLDHVSVYLPLEPFAALHPRLAALGVGATLHASAQRLSLRQPTRATLEVDGLFSTLLPQSGRLGSYRLELDAGEDGSGNWSLRPLSGVLAATGHGTFDTKRLQFHGQLALNPLTPLPGLSTALSWLPASDAGYLVTF